MARLFSRGWSFFQQNKPQGHGTRGWIVISFNLDLTKVRVKLLYMYVKVTGGESLVVSIYVDDMLVTGNKIELIPKLKNEMEKLFEMTDLGIMHYFLGMEVMQSSNGIFICQQKYISEF